MKTNLELARECGATLHLSLDDTATARFTRSQLADFAQRITNGKDAEIAALRKDADLLPMAIMHLAEWANAVQVNGSGWDDWDEHYKDAAYRPGPLRELIDKAMAELVQPANQTEENQ